MIDTESMNFDIQTLLKETQDKTYTEEGKRIVSAMLDSNPYIHCDKSTSVNISRREGHASEPIDIGEQSVTMVVASLYANPLHIGHVKYLQESAKLGLLTVIVNNDEQVALKGSCPFMPQKSRLEIIRALKCVFRAVLSVDTDLSVNKTLRLIHELSPVNIFANGGNEYGVGLYDKEPLEAQFCRENDIKMVFGVGESTKACSSSELISRAAMWVRCNELREGRCNEL